MPLNILMTFIIGSALGWLLIRITRAPNNLRGLVLGCCATGGCYLFSSTAGIFTNFKHDPWFIICVKPLLNRE